MNPHGAFRCFIFLAGCAAYAQLPIGFGIKGGVGLTDAYGIAQPISGLTTQSSAKDYIVGPFVELRLPFGFGVEADGLYRPVSFQSLPEDFRIGILSSRRYTTLEFPVLAKYRLRLPHIKPVIEAGPAFRYHSSDAPQLTSTGFTMGAGIEFKLPVIRLSSDLRSTRWASTTSVNDFNPNLNQVELLFGISF